MVHLMEAERARSIFHAPDHKAPTLSGVHERWTEQVFRIKACHRFQPAAVHLALLFAKEAGVLRTAKNTKCHQRDGFCFPTVLMLGRCRYVVPQPWSAWSGFRTKAFRVLSHVRGAEVWRITAISCAKFMWALVNLQPFGQVTGSFHPNASSWMDDAGAGSSKEPT